ncbi:MAG: type I restriction enzyme HsdR N-terminal domain-containing protein [Tannerellaceae bacterium]|jgi:hypothetical protein|nr:type I restriction enzyme HsdR N-terminal domain-containing protein [Tannerellaceae bacterium]
MPVLNLPAFDVRLTEKEGRRMIFDPFRQRYVALTPEEWVRQHFVNYLVTEKHYPKNLMGNEITIRLNATTRRCDTIIYNRFLAPLMIVEYKSPDLAVKKAVFDQISRYNAALKVRFLTVSNGLRHFCCRIDYRTQTYTFLRSIPCYDELDE